LQKENSSSWPRKARSRSATTDCYIAAAPIPGAVFFKQICDYQFSHYIYTSITIHPGKNIPDAVVIGFLGSRGGGLNTSPPFFKITARQDKNFLTI
jgi:hypothetical protein